jgi:hypothetical protein
MFIRIPRTDICKEAGPKIKTEKNKQAHVFMSRHQNAGQDHSVMVVNKFFENIAKFKYLATMVKIKITSRTDSFVE